jgi:hypothetical protein
MEKVKPGYEIVDCGAIQCPAWFAEALIVLIELEARDQGLKAGADANKNADAWLQRYAPRT